MPTLVKMAKYICEHLLAELGELGNWVHGIEYFAEVQRWDEIDTPEIKTVHVNHTRAAINALWYALIETGY